MEDKIAKALHDLAKDPSLSVRAAAKGRKVPQSTLDDRVKGRHGPRDEAGSRHLSEVQEGELVKTINEYASRGTLLAPRHIAELGQRLCEEKMGKNWGSTFLHRYKDSLDSRFFILQEAGRHKADTVETRTAFYNLVKDAYATHHFKSHNIYNMDETPFNLTAMGRARRVAPRTSRAAAPPHQAAPPRHAERITVVACIGTASAPVPPLVIFVGEGNDIPTNWTSMGDDTVLQLAVKTHTGYNNSFMMMTWLEKAFQPFTVEIADNGREPRLLFLDGADIHIKVEFIEACWAHNIIIIITPASLTSRLQPLDVNFFRTLKLKYQQKLDDYLIGSELQTPTKGMFWGWHQRAWKETATSRQIRAAWRDSGLYPLERRIWSIDDKRTPSPPANILSSDGPETPETDRILRSTLSGVRRGVIDPTKALFKAAKVTERLRAENTLLKDKQEKQEAAKKLREGVTGTRKKQNYPVGELFDPRYQQEHAQELLERRGREDETKEKRRRESAAESSKRKQSRPNFVQSCTLGPSGTS